MSTAIIMMLPPKGIVPVHKLLKLIPTPDRSINNAYNKENNKISLFILDNKFELDKYFFITFDNLIFFIGVSFVNIISRIQFKQLHIMMLKSICIYLTKNSRNCKNVSSPLSFKQTTTS